MPLKEELVKRGDIDSEGASGGTHYVLQRFAAIYLLAGFFLAVSITPSVSTAQDNTAQDNTAPNNTAQDAGSSRVTERERLTAERFLTVLIRRPRPGTALDRVVEFHNRAGSIDTLLDSLVVADDAENAGAKAMVAGLVYLRQGNAAKAAGQLKRAAKLLSDDSVASFQHGVALIQIGELEQAADALRESIERKPARTEAMQVYTTLAQLYARAGDRTKSLDVWNDLQEQFPSDEKIAARIAEELSRSGDSEEARKRFLALAASAKREEDQLRYSVRAAETLRALGKADDALAELTSALAKTRPGSWLSRDIVSRIEEGFTATGDFEGLAKHYQKQIEANPEDVGLPMRLTRIWINLGRLNDAEKVARATLEKVPGDNEVRQSLVDVLQAGGKYTDAAKVQQEMLQSDPENTDIAFALANTLASDPEVPIETRRQRAASVLTSFAERRSDDALLMSQIAQRLKGLEQFDEAIQIAKSAVEIDPSSTPYREYLGELLFDSGQKDEAISTWRSIAEGDRRSKESLVRLAEIFAAFELKDLSVEAWDEAGTFDLDFPTRLRWAKALAEAELHDRAIAVLDEAESIAETPDQRDGLLVARINAYKTAGKLKDRIKEVASQDSSPQVMRELAVLYQTDGQESEAMRAITEAIQLAPQDLAVLTVAADILKRQNRWSEAAEQFAELAKIDRRYQVNHFKQVVSMRIKLGQNDQAMGVCEQIIQASPGSVDAYTFAARTAQRLSRDDDAIGFLRTALEIAPRDNAPRMMLASILSGRFDTDAAIELYWEAFDIADFDERSRVVAALAPLYERRGEIDALVERIGLAGRTDRDLNPRRIGLLTADAFQAIRYDGAVLREINELLLRSPRDVDLLKRALASADAADDLETAVDYARRLVELADTPENRMQLASLKWQSGQIEIDEFLQVRLSTLDSPERITRIINASVTRGDLATARKACEFALEKNPDLWDIRLYLAQISLHELFETLPPPPSVRDMDEAEKSKRRDRLREELRKLCNAFKDDAVPGEALPPATKSITKSNTMSAYQWSTWNSTLRILQRAYRAPPYNDSYYQRQPGTNLMPPINHRHATAIAAGLLMAGESDAVRLAMSESSDFELESACKELAQAMEPWTLPEAESGSNMIDFLGERFLRSVARTWADALARQKLSGNEYTNWNNKNKHGLSLPWERSLDARFAAARIDLEYGFPDLLNHIRGRIERGVFARKAAERLANEDLDEKTRKELEEQVEKFKPFPPDRIEELEKWAGQWKRLRKKNDSQTQIEHQALIWNEWIAADQPERAEPFSLVIDENSTYAEQVRILKWFYQLEWFDKADKALPILLDTVRTRTPTRDRVEGTVVIYQSQVWRNADRYREFVDGKYDLLLEIAVAQTARSAPSIRNCSPSAEGYFNKSVRNLEGGSSYARLRSPLLPSLLPDSLIYDFVYLCDRPSNMSYDERGSIDVPNKVLAALTRKAESYTDEDLTPPAGIDPYEVDNEQTRRHLEAQFTHVLAAFVDWWNGQPDQALVKIRRLHQLNPSNIALALELSRLQAEIGSPKEAIATLDSFEVLNSDTLLRKELAILNLASMAGDPTRAGRAAERLFGMRMDRSMQMALATQLQQLGMKEKSGEILARARRGRSSDVSTLISLASSLAASDRDTEAAEVAYDAFKRLSSRRSQQSNEEYYRRRAIDILKNSKRLDPIIAAAEKRYEEAPTSKRLRTQLSELYSAAGKTQELAKLFENVTEASVEPRAQMTQAQNLFRARKYDESAIAYAKALVAAPTMAGNEYYNFQNSYVQAKNKAKLESIKVLSKMDFSKVESYRVSEFVELCSPNSYYGRQLTSLGDEGEEVILQYLENLLLTLRDDQAKVSMLGKIPEKYVDKSEKLKKWFETELLKPSTFAPRNPISSINSYSGNGVANGAILRIVEVLATEPMRTRAKETINQILEKHPKTDDKFSADHTTALLYMLLLDSKIADTVKTEGVDPLQELSDDQWLARIEEVTASLSDVKVGAAVKDPSEAIASGLVWQAAQILQSSDQFPKGERRDQCFEKLYRYAYVTNSQSQFQYSPGPRWLSFASKTRPKLEIRDELWRVIRSTDYFRDDAYNPGYGDYQMINAYSSFATQFEKLEFPIDALALMAELIQDPSRFERAANWGGGRGGADEYIARAKKYRDSITGKQANEYLDLLMASWDTSEQDTGETSKPKPSLSRVKLETVLASKDTLGFVRAIEVILEQDNSDELIAKIQEELTELQSTLGEGGDEAGHPGIATLQFAFALGGDDEKAIDQAFDRYVEASPETMLAEQVVDAALMMRFIGGRPVARPVADKLLAHVTENAAESPDLELKLRRLLQSKADRRKELIAMIETTFTSDPDAMISAALFDEGLRLCFESAEQGELVESANLAKLLLTRGLPIRSTTQGSVKDAFALRQSSGSSNRANQLKPRMNDVERILDLADLWGKSLELEQPLTGWPKTFVTMQEARTRTRRVNFLGLPIPSNWLGAGNKKPSGVPIQETIGEANREAASAVYAALTQIQSVAPADIAPGFAGRLITETLLQYNSQSRGMRFRSLEIARSRIAMASEIPDLLEDIAANSVEGDAAGGPRKLSEAIERAHARLDEKSLVSALEGLERALDEQLPAANETVRVTSVQSYSMDEMTQVANVLDPLEAPLRALLPVANNDQLSKESQRRSTVLCKRMLIKMKQQKVPSHFFDQARMLIQRTVDRLLKDASGDRLNDEVENIIQEASQRAEQYGGSPYGAEQFSREVQTRMTGLMSAGSSSNTQTAEADLARFVENRDAFLPLLQASWPGYAIAQVAPNDLIFRYLRSIDPKARVDLLSKLILDPLPDSIQVDPTLVATVPRGSLIAMPPSDISVLPEFMSRQMEQNPINEMTKWRKELLAGIKEMSLPRIDNDRLYPFSDMAVILADSAAISGQSNALAAKLREIAEEPGDPASCILALVLQADSIKNQTEHEELAGLFDDALVKVKQQLEETSELQYQSRQGMAPAVGTLVLRAHQSSIPRAATLDDWRLLKEAGDSIGYTSLRSWMGHFRRQFPMDGYSEEIPIPGFATSGDSASVAMRDGGSVLFKVDGDVQRVWFGEGRLEMYVPFPLVGSFTVSYETTHRFDKIVTDSGDEPKFSVDAELGYPVYGLNLNYGDVALNLNPNYVALDSTGDYQMDDGELTISIRDQFSPEFHLDSFRPTEWTTESMSVTPESVSGGLDGTTYVKLDGDFSAYPWLHLRTGYSAESVWKNLRIEGDVSIPRYVDLINDRLIGFRQFGGAGLPEIEAPQKLLNDLGTSESDSNMSMHESSSSQIAAKWSVADRVLSLRPSEDLPAPSNPDQSELPPEALALTMLNYQRPLLEGERVQGEFRLIDTAKPTETSTAYLQIGGVLLCMNKDGVIARARDLSQPVIPWDGVEITLTNDGPREGWNEFVIERRDGRVFVELNDKSLIDFETVERTPYGFGGDSRYGVDFQSLRLTGPWPESVPTEWQR